jgi:uncharacterized protein YacL
MGQPRFTQTDNHSQAASTDAGATSPLKRNLDLWALRGALLGASIALCYTLNPFGLQGLPAAGLGFFVAMVILLAELRLRHAEISGLVGGAVGALLGLFAALLVTLVVSRTSEPESTKSFFEFISLFAFSFLGLVLGSRKGFHLPRLSVPATPAQLPATNLFSLKLLDTSVLIDGRIADICETHFLDGALGVPRFVLHELQLVADSSDSLKRQRGRRGLEVLQRMQKMPGLEVRILEDDIPGVVAVDQKLVDLGRRLNAKIVTNDFNLNKVARVQGIAVLNINELANALKPAVLPGESMRVLILREGKESSQGVAYLDDGTMVVVDGARRLINRTVDILVTSIHQTPAGKMIFGRLNESSDQLPAHRQGGVGNGSTQLRPETTAANGAHVANGNGMGARPEPAANFDPNARPVYSDNDPA